MAYTSSTQAYVGKGQFYLALRSGGPLVAVGNVSEASFAIEENTVDQLDYTIAGGGKRESLSRITAVTGSMTLLEFSPANLALALRGASSAITSAAVTGEEHTAYQGGFIPFDFIPDPTVSFVVKSEDGLTTYSGTTDYTASATGITILATGTISDEDVIQVAYTKNAGSVIQALTSSALEYRLYFDGLNEGDGGNPVTLDVHRVKFSPASDLGLISDEWANLPVTFEVLADPNKDGTTTSRYFKVGKVG
jgi:hypothetical protein